MYIGSAGPGPGGRTDGRTGGRRAKGGGRADGRTEGRTNGRTVQPFSSILNDSTTIVIDFLKKKNNFHTYNDFHRF